MPTYNKHVVQSFREQYPGIHKDSRGTLLKEASKSQLPTDPYRQNNLNTKGNQRNVTNVLETLCKHPTMELWPSNIKYLMAKELFVLNCDRGEADWIYIGSFSIYFNIGAEKLHGNITCDCTSVERETDYKVKCCHMTLMLCQIYQQEH